MLAIFTSSGCPSSGGKGERGNFVAAVKVWEFAVTVGVNSPEVAALTAGASTGFNWGQVCW
jgi:hypothetical protein